MCVRLKQWPIDRLRRRLSPRRRESGDCQWSGKFLALVQTIASRQVVVAACEAARARGVRPGITLAEARALCPALTHDDYRPDKDLKSLESLARWMARFSPAVAVEPPDALMLDVTGSERLFRGMDRLARLASEAVARLNFAHGIAIAPTPGAAWALASFGRGGVFSPDQIPGALAPLPVEALRLEAGLADAFGALGVETIGQLMRLPRESLPARFGLSVLTRLDQALGRSPEPLVAVRHSEPIVARFDFDGVVIDSLETIWLVFQRLLAEVLAELRRRGCGARKLFADYLLPRAAPVRKTILLSRPTCDAASLFNLLRCATETVKQGDGFAGLQLSVPVFERVTQEQLHLLDHETQAAENEMGHLIERLRVRLGEGAVLFAKLVESHLPEKAFRYTEADEIPGSDSRAKMPRLIPSPGTAEEGKGGSPLYLPSRMKDSDHDHASACRPERSEAPAPSLGIFSAAGAPTGGFAAPSSVPPVRAPAALETFSRSLRTDSLASGMTVRSADPTETGKSLFPLPRYSGGGGIAPRPLHLLPTPAEVLCTAVPAGEFEGVPVSFTYEAAVFQVARAAGPERISGTWWEGRHKTRDYFDVEDTAGRRFWMFQVAETRKWYLHGMFD